MSKIPTSLIGRGTKLFGLASKLALNEVSSRLKTWESESERVKTKMKLAHDVVKTLSQLKGASMKLGQLMSLDMGDYLPPEVMKILEQLHQKTTFIPLEKIQGILKSELKDKYNDIKFLSETPIAAASIGQVHRAKLGNDDIVIKVQYPGVAESIPSDLKILEMIMNKLSFVQGKDTDLKPFMEEVKEVMLKESDYVNELMMHELYKEKFEGSPYIIPKSYPEYSTSKVLSQEYIEGISFSEWLETNPPEEIKSEFAKLLMELYLKEVFHYGIVQTDPNPGNFLITPENKIALLDFGAVKSYTKTFVESYRKVLIASYHGKTEKIIEESIMLGFLDARESQEAREIYLEMMEFLAEPFRQEHDFDFTDKSFFNRSTELTWELNRKCKYSPPPKDLLFLHRKLAGIFIFIKKLDVKIRLKDYWSYVENS